MLLIAVAAVVAFQTNLVGLTFPSSQPTYDTQIIESVSVKGAVSVKALRLSPKEMRNINFMAIKNQDIFPAMDVTVNMQDQFAPVVVERGTGLELTMVFKTDETCEVRFWTRKVTRAGLVPLMIRSMKKAAAEYLHYRDLPEKGASFKRLYI